MQSLLFTTFLFIAFTSYGQAVDDSVIIERQQAAFFLTSTHPDSALSIAEKDLQLSLQTGNKRVEAYCYKTKGWAYFRLGNADSCIHNLTASNELFRQLNDTSELMLNYLNMASVYSNFSRFSESASFLMKADSIAKSMDNKKVQAAINRQMGILYREQGQYAKAIPYFKASMQQYLAMNDTIHFSDAISGLSITYNRLNQNDSNLALLKYCASLLNRMKGYNYQKGILNEKFGDAYFALSSYPQSLNYYKLAYNLFSDDNNAADMAFEAINVGKSYQKTGKYNEAEKYLLQAYTICDSLNMVNYAHDAATQLSELYKTKGDWKSGFHWLSIASELNDSLNVEQQNEKVAELQAKYETEKKDKEISLLKKDRELNLANLQKQKVFRYGAFIVLALLTLSGALAINRYRTIQRARRQIEMEKLRNDIARDLHDDMGSVLSSINVMSKVALKGPPGKENIVEDNLKKIHENSNYMLESMSDIVWAINPVNDSFEKTLFRMKEFAADILEPLNIQYEFELSQGLNSINIGLRKRKDLFLFFKEAVNNAAKYSRCTKVVIKITEQNEFILLLIEDNGVGFDTAKNYTGNGMRNMKQRAEQMNGEYAISSEEGKGTSIRVKIKSHD